MPNHLVNPQLIEMAQRAAADLQKAAFVPGGDPAMDPTAGGGGMDPSMMGGGMDPSMMGGGGGGGMPPAPPAAPPPGGGGMQPAMQPVEPIKPKIDVNVTMLQILKLLARISDALGVPVPASEMVATQNDLTQMGMQQQNANAGGGQQSAIAPIQPIGAAAPGMGGGGGGDPTKQSADTREGAGYDGAGLETMGTKAAALDAYWRERQRRGKPAA